MGVKEAQVGVKGGTPLEAGKGKGEYLVWSLWRGYNPTCTMALAWGNPF